MGALDRLIAAPRLREIDAVEVAASPALTWQVVRHADLARSRVVRALFEVRLLPERLAGKPVELAVRLDEMRSSPAQPGFQILVDEPPHEVAVGAIGKVWRPDIPFVHVPDAASYRAFAEPDEIKVAWALRVAPRAGERGSRIELEVRVDATSERAWRNFRRYFALIGIGSRFIRRSLLRSLVRELGPIRAKAGVDVHATH